MSADQLLSRLDKVRPTGHGTWQALCPAHDDRTPSLAVRELSDGRVLCHCFGGCDVYSVLSAVSLGMAALYPAREIQHARSERRPFPAADVLQCIAFEALIVAVAGAALLNGKTPFSEFDRARLMLAVSRIGEAVSAAGLDRG